MGYMGHMMHWVKYAIHLIHLGIELIATEKYHGTSANITQVHNKDPTFYSGGEIQKHFEDIFDKELIQRELDLLMVKNEWVSITVHGEAYGGPRIFPKQMGNTYGIDKPNFIVFDVRIIDKQSKKRFLNFSDTEKIAELLKLDLVHYCKCPYEIIADNTDKILDWVEQQTNLPSTCPFNTAKNPREGVVIRPVVESTIGKKQDRAICKSLNENFKETKTVSINKDNVKKLKEKSLTFSKYDEIAEEWVTENRGRHVLDEIRSNRDDKKITMKDIRIFLDKIIEDIIAESEGDIDWPQDVKEDKNLRRSISQEASNIFKSLCEEFNYVASQSSVNTNF